MKISRIDHFHAKVRRNKWMGYFAIFCRITLAMGFLPSGFVKVNGERFTDLHNLHPLGQYLESLFHTGYYYPFIGVMQMTAAVLLLIPRTALLGAVIYFPIIFNITVLSLAVRFQGSLLTAPLMVLANLYLFGWYYHRIKYILPFKKSTYPDILDDRKNLSNKFPYKFFAAVFITIVYFVVLIMNVYDVMPMNTLEDCNRQCTGDDKRACAQFCECIHTKGNDFTDCHDTYLNSVENK